MTSTQPPPSGTDLAGGSGDAATRKDAGLEPSRSSQTDSPQPPAVCSNCGVPFNEYRRNYLEHINARPSKLTRPFEGQCTDCVAMSINGTQRPAPPEPVEPGPHDWDVDMVDYVVGGT